MHLTYLDNSGKNQYDDSLLPAFCYLFENIFSTFTTSFESITIYNMESDGYHKHPMCQCGDAQDLVAEVLRKHSFQHRQAPALAYDNWVPLGSCTWTPRPQL